jgi:hypothetical protein
MAVHYCPMCGSSLVTVMQPKTTLAWSQGRTMTGYRCRSGHIFFVAAEPAEDQEMKQTGS